MCMSHVCVTVSHVCMYVCMCMYVYVCVHACTQCFVSKRQHTVVLPHSGMSVTQPSFHGMKVTQPFFGMRVMHWKTWRKGQVIQHFSEGFRANKMTILFDDGAIELRWIGAFVQDFPEEVDGLRKETGRLTYFASLHKYAHAYIYIYIYIYMMFVY